MAEHNVCKFLDEPRGFLPKPSDKNPSSSGSKEAFGQSTIVIDNGSYECRAGYGHSIDPTLVFKNLASRQKGRNNEADICVVGLDIENLETFRTQLRSPYDKNVVTQFDAQEMVFDYIFNKLGVKSEEKVEHSIFMNEPVANPNVCRKHMAELLFECYSVPEIGFFTDSMASWYDCKNSSQNQNGIVISIGYQVTHVAPVIEGIMDLQNTKRIAIGGYHLDYFMQRLLQLKYPIHSTAITLSRAEEIVQTLCHIAEDYSEGCNRWLTPSYYEQNVKRMQLPYGNVPANFAAVALQGELQAERTKLIKEKQALERLEDKKHIYDQLCEIRELTGTKLYRRLAELGVESLGELQCHIKAVQGTVEDLKRKLSFKEQYSNGTLTKEWLQNKIDDLDNPEKLSNFSSFDVAEYYQLHVGIEQIRVPEVLFQPSMIGIDQGGICETLSYILTKYSEETQAELSRKNYVLKYGVKLLPALYDNSSPMSDGLQPAELRELKADLSVANLISWQPQCFIFDIRNILLTGGCANIPGLKERFEADFRSARPFKSEIGVTLAKNPRFSSWRGARKWLLGDDRSSIAITKQHYDEVGGEYLVEHQLSNRHYPTPKLHH